ncbi:MAG: hypothetical protein V1708_05825 [Candidatus Micrarchaeota archaeon]
MANVEEFIALFVPLQIVFILVAMFAFGYSPEGAVMFLWGNPLGLFLMAFFFLAPDYFMSQLLPGAKILFYMSAILWIVSATGGMI